MTFIAPGEVQDYEKWQGVAFDVQVANQCVFRISSSLIKALTWAQ